MPRKLRTRQHIIADLGENYVERQALLCGHSVERVVHDYGYDLVLYSYDDRGEIEGGCVYLQVKATDHLKVLMKVRATPVKVARGDVSLWLEEPMPVILVVYDARSDIAYWLHIQGDPRVSGRAEGKTVTLQVPKGNRVDPASMGRFATLKNDGLKRLRERVAHD